MKKLLMTLLPSSFANHALPLANVYKGASSFDTRVNDVQHDK